jgi:hypothetical protein
LLRKADPSNLIRTKMGRSNTAISQSGNCEGYRGNALHPEDIGKVRMERQFGIYTE